MDKKYYIVSNKHTDGLTRMFWQPNNNGYTIDLNRAGVYELDNRYPLITKENLHERGKYQTFYIAVEDVELLGRKMVCILN